ncbi:MAG TPA: hypothetical protein VMH82_03340, partial [Myxococcota bacterium]|nr:hypothetical protein [Myxococcota bacterium]
MIRLGVCLALILGSPFRAASDCILFGTPPDYTWPSPDCFNGLPACLDSLPCDGGTVEIATDEPITDAISFQKGLTLRAYPGYQPIFTAKLTAATPTDSSGVGYYIRIEGLTFEGSGQGSEIEVVQGSPSPLTVEVVGNTVATDQNTEGGIEIFGSSGPISFQVSDNTLEVAKNSSEQQLGIAVGLFAAAAAATGTIERNSIVMQRGAEAIAIDLGDQDADLTVDVFANRISGTDYNDGVYLQRDGLGTTTARIA